MPQISKQSIRVIHKDVKKNYEVVVMYNQDHEFYIKFPDEFHDLLTHMSEEEQKGFSIKPLYRSKYVSYGEKPLGFLVRADKEVLCIERMKTALEALIDRTITKRNVIIVFFNPRDLVQYGGHQYNAEHEQIGFKFGLTYAVETTTGDKKVYNIYTNHGKMWGDKEDNITRTEIDLWNESSCIIDDTPENREVLEGLYKATEKLIEKLKDFTKTPDIMQSLINSKIKFLGE